MTTDSVVGIGVGFAIGGCVVGIINEVALYVGRVVTCCTCVMIGCGVGVGASVILTGIILLPSLSVIYFSNTCVGFGSTHSPVIRKLWKVLT